MKKFISSIYRCYMIKNDHSRVGFIYDFLRTDAAKHFFDIYSTDADSVKKFMDALRYIVNDEKIKE